MSSEIFRKGSWRPSRYLRALQMVLDLCDSVVKSNPQSLFWGELHQNFITSANITSLPVTIVLVDWMSADRTPRTHGNPSMEASKCRFLNLQV